MEMGVTVAQNEEKLFGKQYSASDHDRAEKNHDTSNSSIEVTQLALLLTTCKSRNENVGQHVHQDGEDHGETSKCSDFRDRRRVTPKKTNQEDRDLTLKTIKERVRGEVLDQPNDLTSIFRVFIGIKIDNFRGVGAQEEILQDKSSAGDGNSQSSGRQQINQSQNEQEANDRADKIYSLNSANVRVETRDHAINIRRKLNGESGQNDDDQKQRVDRRSAVLRQHRIQDRGDDNRGGSCKFSAHGQAGIDQFTETMSILPDAAADRDQSDTDADVGEQHQCGLQRVSD